MHLCTPYYNITLFNPALQKQILKAIRNPQEITGYAAFPANYNAFFASVQNLGIYLHWFH